MAYRGFNLDHPPCRTPEWLRVHSQLDRHLLIHYLLSNILPPLLHYSTHTERHTHTHSGQPHSVPFWSCAPSHVIFIIYPYIHGSLSKRCRLRRDGRTNLGVKSSPSPLAAAAAVYLSNISLGYDDRLRTNRPATPAAGRAGPLFRSPS